MARRTTPLRPEGAPRLGETYRDWRDFTDRVARPWLENDGQDAKADNWYHALMLERDPWYVACALVMADNRIRELEARQWVPYIDCKKEGWCGLQNNHDGECVEC